MTVIFYSLTGRETAEWQAVAQIAREMSGPAKEVSLTGMAAEGRSTLTRPGPGSVGAKDHNGRAPRRLRSMVDTGDA